MPLASRCGKRLDCVIRNRFVGFSGINACKCGEVVVKAAKVQKPLFYASPEAIVEAAAARQAVGSVASLSNSNKPCGSGSFSSSSSLSSVGLIGGSKASSRAKLIPFTSVSGRLGANCGCGKTSESLQVRDLLTSNVEGKVVPRYLIHRDPVHYISHYILHYIGSFALHRIKQSFHQFNKLLFGLVC